MANLLFSLNATLPIFLVMVLGYGFRQKNIIDEGFASKMNSFVFKIALPVNLFVQLHDVDFFAVWDTKYVLYCFGVTLASVGIGWLISHIFRDRGVRGEFIQGSYRSSASLLGMAYIENIYGEASLGSLMMLGSVPLYNVMAVIILSLTRPGMERAGIDKKELKKSLIGIATNPIIWGILLGFAWAVFREMVPTVASLEEQFSFAETTLSYIGRLASPMGLLAMGAMLDFGALSRNLRPILLATFLKLFGYTTLFLPLAVAMGFMGEKLVATLIMLGSASTVAGYVMARNMGHEGTVSAGTVALSTVLSIFSLTFWIWLLRGMMLI